VTGEALKLTTYFGERARVGGRLLAEELLDIQARHAIRLGVLLRGIQGFGAKHHLRSDRLLTLSEDLPLVSIAIDARERIEVLRGDLAALGGEGLLTMERAVVLDASSPASQLPAGSELKLTVCLGRHERVAGEPAFAAVCNVLRDAGVSGATVLLGVDGTVRGERRRARFFAGNRGVPLLVLSVGAAEPIVQAVQALAQMLPSPLLTIEQVLVCKRDGELLQAPGGAPLTDRAPASGAVPAAGGEGRRQKLTVVTSEAAWHEGRPVYLELVRRLRAAGAAGATALRGIWGFHGEHAPHGDRLLSLRRHVPVVTEVIDTPARIAALFGIVDELTRERGLVTSELVPLSAALRAPPAL
jgi:PII-like signaling protein